MTILQIFAAFFRVGALTLGGGLAIISILRHELTVKRAWIGEEEFAHNLAMATSVPGAMVVNFSLLCGHRLRGARGAAAAFLGTVLPSLIAIVAVAVFLSPYFSHPAAAAFLRGAAAAVAGLLTHTAFTVCRPMVAKAPHFAAAAIAAGLALVPTVNPVFALVLVGAVMFHLSNRQKVRAGGDGGIKNGINGDANGGINNDAIAANKICEGGDVRGGADNINDEGKR
ncbi:MAG: chromate transporter [Chitinispirillales bacterium]|nr:chromate transporter [Chitinispirillales bacterium]